MNRDLKRVDTAVGSSWDEVRSALFTEEEIAESNMRVAMVGKLIQSRREKESNHQKIIKELSGMDAKQPVIPGTEKSTANRQREIV